MKKKDFRILKASCEAFCENMYRMEQNPLPHVRKILGIDIKYFEGEYSRFPGYQFTGECVALRDLQTGKVWIKFPSFYNNYSEFKIARLALLNARAEDEDEDLYTK